MTKQKPRRIGAVLAVACAATLACWLEANAQDPSSGQTQLEAGSGGDDMIESAFKKTRERLDRVIHAVRQRGGNKYFVGMVDPLREVQDDGGWLTRLYQVDVAFKEDVASKGTDCYLTGFNPRKRDFIAYFDSDCNGSLDGIQDGGGLEKDQTPDAAGQRAQLDRDFHSSDGEFQDDSKKYRQKYRQNSVLGAPRQPLPKKFVILLEWVHDVWIAMEFRDFTKPKARKGTMERGEYLARQEAYFKALGPLEPAGPSTSGTRRGSRDEPQGRDATPPESAGETGETGETGPPPEPDRR